MEVKTYTTIFDKAKAAHGTGAYDDATLEFLFPDLKVSEDERIRKHIVEILKRLPGCHWYGQKEKDDCLAYLEKQKEQKPRDYRKLYEEVVNSEWFKQNYVGKSLGEEENPKEWSEADEKQIRQIERIVKDAGCTQKLQEQIHNWLKSLRPTHWKPSEAHLSALLAVFNDPNNIGSQTCQLALTDLYDQLNKL